MVVCKFSVQVAFWIKRGTVLLQKMLTGHRFL